MLYVETILEILGGIFGTLFLAGGVKSIKESNRIIKKKEREHTTRHEEVGV